MENDDKLIAQFFAEHKQEVADQGFSRRVMHRLPYRKNRIYLVWNFLCFTLAAALFVWLDGARMIWNALREVFTGMVESGAAQQIDPRSLAIAAVVLLFLGYKKIASLA